MSIPKYDEFYNIILEFLSDEKIHKIKDCREYIIKVMNFSEEEIKELLPVSKLPKLNNRIGWGIAYLKNAEMLSKPKRGYIKITDAGKNLLKKNITVTNKILSGNYLLENLFDVPNDLFDVPNEEYNQNSLNEESTPEEIFERVYQEINFELSDEILSIISSMSPKFFERLVIILVEKMGYGTGTVTPYVKDEGLDGIVYGDKLGFERIGIQAKLWNRDKTISRPEVQKFYGALANYSTIGKIDKGLFVTTAKFSPQAKKYADEQHIVLIDGKRLAELMIEFEVGVSTQKIYKIKRINNDFFDDE
ncbi:MAG: restriction endonuclease [Selenomonadaceae bacterium]|nr:restriction endonuclease [Selenomonadaceae bacterium]